MKKELIVILLVGICLGQNFNLIDSFQGQSFFDNFNFITYDDPTHGFVDYVSREEAFNSGFAKVNPNSQVYIGADTTNVVQPGQRGRKSVRLESKKQYRGGLFVFDLQHMPEGCATWPAYWMCGENWPNNGEIDIIEGVNLQSTNSYTLHTRDGCTMDPNIDSGFDGTWNLGSAGNPATNCYVNAPNQYNNQGCSVAGGFYGKPFNQYNGGVVVTYWDVDNFIKVWNFPSFAVPSDIRGNKPNPSSWGLPMAAFKIGSSCSSDHFGNQNIIINLTFCGDWAGSVFDQFCPGQGSCVDFVKYHPDAFKNAYWLINSLKVYNQAQNQENQETEQPRIVKIE